MVLCIDFIAYRRDDGDLPAGISQEDAHYCACVYARKAANVTPCREKTVQTPPDIPDFLQWNSLAGNVPLS